MFTTSNTSVNHFFIRNLVTAFGLNQDLMDFNRKLKQKKNYLISKSIGAFSL